jgi:hypothetical protein
MEKWQARRKLNRDPAAITSLRVACRYSSRPPSDPLKTYLSRTRSSGRVLLLFTALFFAIFRRLVRFAAALCDRPLIRDALAPCVRPTKFVTQAVTNFCSFAANGKRFAARRRPFVTAEKY